MQFSWNKNDCTDMWLLCLSWINRAHLFDFRSFCDKTEVAPTESCWENTTWRWTTRLVPWPSAPPSSLSTLTGTPTESCTNNRAWRYLPMMVLLLCSYYKCCVCVPSSGMTLPWSSWQLPSRCRTPSCLPVCPALEKYCLTMLPATSPAGDASGVSSTGNIGVHIQDVQIV